MRAAVGVGAGTGGSPGALASLLAVGDPLPGLGPPLRGPVGRALDGLPIADGEAALLADCPPQALPDLCRAAAMLRDAGKGRTVTFSPKVFIPVTRLCRDVCGYCAFRQEPSEAERLYVTPEEALAVAKAGERLGCTEALLTLGERPEQRYPEAREWLRRRGHRTTLEYVAALSALILRETSLLPHANPGTMSAGEMGRLRPVSASMGLMLETVSERLHGPGGPHERAPSKRPAARLKTLESAGRLRVAFTTGLLIGIGETRHETVAGLLAIRDLHLRHGHVQEVIIQSFRAKPATALQAWPEPTTDDLLWALASARLILGPAANLQVPPNLSANDYHVALMAGVNDWGGVSPLTMDYVNPEAPWPRVSELRARTEAMGFDLRPRLPLYPEYLTARPEFVPEGLRDRVQALATADGYGKGGVERYA